jgi:nitroimidazol reductase NimA-like FMN-containing flavoprotein (pyridoxamine 5'-phosphate oxidase superfamily)
MLERMKRLVKDGDICVLATVSEGKPHCSLMAYVSDEDCREIYMVTQRETTKFRNLSENPSVSLLIDTREEHQGKKRPEAMALTVDGVFQHIEDEVKKRYVRTMLLERHPHLKIFLDHPHAELICIRISSFLLLDGIEDSHFVEL